MNSLQQAFQKCAKDWASYAGRSVRAEYSIECDDGGGDVHSYGIDKGAGSRAFVAEKCRAYKRVRLVSTSRKYRASMIATVQS